jgi:hypothetical protein
MVGEIKKIRNVQSQMDDLMVAFQSSKEGFEKSLAEGRDRLQKMEENQRQSRETQKLLLKDRLVQAYDDAVERGGLSRYTFCSLEEIYEEYTALGGNGFVKALMEDLKELDIRD